MKKQPRANIFIVTEEGELMKFLIKSLPHKNRDNIKSLLKNKQVLVDGQAVSRFNYRLIPGQKVETGGGTSFNKFSLHGISILLEDPYLIVIDKHAGVLSVSTDTHKGITAYSMLSYHVKIKDPSAKIFVVHRIDRETSGLMMFAKSEKVQKLIQDDWHRIVTERSYLAIIEGSMEPPEGQIVSYLKENKAYYVYSDKEAGDGREAVTHYKTLREKNGYSLLQVKLDTGKKHQIRVHMKDAGHPLVGDKKYGSKVNPIGRLGLHSWILAFTHPVTGEELHFETNKPRKFLRLF